MADNTFSRCMTIENHDILFERQVSLSQSDLGFVEIMIDDLAALVSVKELQKAIDYCSTKYIKDKSGGREDDVIAKELWKEIYLEERKRVRTSTDAADHADKAVEEFYKTFK